MGFGQSKKKAQEEETARKEEAHRIELQRELEAARLAEVTRRWHERNWQAAWRIANGVITPQSCIAELAHYIGRNPECDPTGKRDSLGRHVSIKSIKWMIQDVLAHRILPKGIEPPPPSGWKTGQPVPPTYLRGEEAIRKQREPFPPHPQTFSEERRRKFYEEDLPKIQNHKG